MKRLLINTAILMALWATTAFPEPAQKPVWELGTEMSRITYEEPGVMKEEGTMFGLLGSYTSYGSPMLKAEGRLSFGTVDYDGAYQDGTPVTISNIPDVMLELRGMVGTELGKPVLGNQENKTKFYLYGGLGYRYLNDDSSVADAGGYERESNYLYLPVGIDTIHDMENNWSMCLKLEYDLFLMGTQVSHLSDVDPGFNDLVNEQASGSGYRLALNFQQKGQTTNFAIGFFLRYWDIGESEEADLTYYGRYIGSGVEPENNSKEIGLMVAVRF